MLEIIFFNDSLEGPWLSYAGPVVCYTDDRQR